MEIKIADVMAKRIQDASGLQCLVVESSRKQGKSGMYVMGKIQDNTGKIEFKVWNDPEVQDIMAQGQIVVLTSASVSEYNGALQVIVNKAAPISRARAESAGIIPASPISTELLGKMYEAVITAVKTDGINGFERIEEAINWFKGRGIWDMFLTYPAAIKHHQAYIRGLFEHSVNVARIAGMVLKVYEQHPGYAKINKGLLLTGALLHDIGKCQEYQLNDIGLAESLTLTGGLEGHLVTGAALVEEAYKNILSFDDLIKLKHIILSHHGQRDWGAVVEPKSMEALIIHQADMIDSNFERFTCAGSDQGIWRNSISGQILSPDV